MSAAVRIGGLFRIGPQRAWLLLGAFIVAVTGAVALATRFQLLAHGIAGMAVAIVTAISFRWPIVSLAAFAALIPIEEVVLVGVIGTLSRFAAILFAITYGLPRLTRLALGTMPPASWAYVAWACISFAWAIEPDVALRQIPTLIQLFVVALLIADFVVHKPGVIRPLMWIYSLSAAAIALVGIVGFVNIGEAGRVSALQGQNPAAFAAILVPALVFVMYEVIFREGRLPGIGVALLTALGLIVSGTRGAWLACGVAFLVMLLTGANLRRRVLAVLAAVVLGIALLQFPGVSDLILNRASTALATGGTGRLDIWTIGARIYESAPILGVGYANFPIAYTPEVVRSVDVSYLALSGAGSHNLLVGTLVELGPIGLITLAFFLGPLLVREGWGPDAAVVRTVLVALITTALFVDIVADRKQVWLAIGFATGLAYLARRRAETSDGDADHPLGNPPDPLLAVSPQAGTPLARP
jgi:O-antigen ligase